MNNLFNINYIDLEDRRVYNRLKKGQLCLYIINDLITRRDNTYYIRVNKFDSDELIAAGHTRVRMGKLITGDVMLVFDATEGIDVGTDSSGNLRLNNKAAAYGLAELLGIDPTKQGKMKLLLNIELLTQDDTSMHIYRVSKP